MSKFLSFRALTQSFSWVKFWAVGQVLARQEFLFLPLKHLAAFPRGKSRVVIHVQPPLPKEITKETRDPD